MEFHVKFGTLSNIYVFLDTSVCINQRYLVLAPEAVGTALLLLL